MPSSDQTRGEGIQRVIEPDVESQNEQDWSVPLSSRREGRERVVSLLYEMSIKGYSQDQLLGEMTLNLDSFITKRFLGINNYREQLDQEIASLSRDWDPERMPIIDRNILELGLFELLFCPEVPTGVILSEAVELAQSLSTDNSGKFINGLLSAASKKIRQI